MSSTEGWARDVEGRAKGSSDLIQGLRMMYNPPLIEAKTENHNIFSLNGKSKASETKHTKGDRKLVRVNPHFVHGTDLDAGKTKGWYHLPQLGLL